MNQPWLQNYDPVHSPILSTLLAATPVAILLGSIAILRIRIHFSALLGLSFAGAIAVGIYGMPAKTAVAAGAFGAAFGLFPVSWIVLNVMFLYQLTVDRGLFGVLRDSLARVAPDPRVQVILIAFSFGAFVEGVAGFGAPVAITAAILIQLGFKPLHASGLALIANTAPVAFGSLGIPITTLEQVTGLDAFKISAMVGRQLPLFSALIPFWVVAAYAGWRSMLGVWPAALVAGVAFAVPQFLVSNFHGPWLVDTISGASSILALIALLRFWKPLAAQPGPALSPAISQPAFPRCQLAAAAGDTPAKLPGTESSLSTKQVFRSWLPWLILTALMLVWGLPRFKARLDRVASPSFAVPYLDKVVQRVPPVAAVGAQPETANFPEPAWRRW